MSEMLSDNVINGSAFRECKREFISSGKSDGAIHNARLVVSLHSERMSAAVLG
jgi:hypothetical protein